MLIPFQGNVSRISLEELLERIEYADNTEMDAIILAVQQHYRMVFPDWKILFLSIPAGDGVDHTREAALLIEEIKRIYPDK